MGKTVAVYDTKNISMTINGGEVSLDLGEGTVKIGGEESIDFRTSMSGVPLFSRKKGSLHRKVVFPVIKQSSLNATLTGLEQAGTYFSFSCTDLNTYDSYVSAKCVVMKKPSPEIGDNSDIEWEIMTTYMDATVIGNDQ